MGNPTENRNLEAREKLNKLHNKDGLSWRKIADLPQFKGIVKAGTLCSFAKGTYVPSIENDEVRNALGLDIIELIPQVRDIKSGQFSKRSE